MVDFYAPNALVGHGCCEQCCPGQQTRHLLKHVCGPEGYVVTDHQAYTGVAEIARHYAYLVDRDPQSVGGDAQRRAVVRPENAAVRYPG